MRGGVTATGWELLQDHDAYQLFERPNALLLFRVLKGFFGDADLLGATVAEDESGELSAIPLTTDWGFAFHISSDLVSEVRSLDGGRRHVVRFWGPSAVQSKGSYGDTEDAIQRFIADLKAAFESNLHLFHEGQELAARTPDFVESFAQATINVSREKYQAAVRLFEAAEKSLVQEGTTKALLLGAATLFFISLEAFINLLYLILLRPGFDQEGYKRLVIRDFDLRVLSLHVFCRGFTRQPIHPDSDLWRELMQLRDFRNDLVHGNVTDEHRMHTLSEDIYMFCYEPSRDYRGPKKTNSDRISPYTFDIDAEFVRRVRGIVDRAEEAVVDALDANLSSWGRELFDEDVLGSPLASPGVVESQT